MSKLIDSFPPPFNSKQTPYKENDFRSVIKQLSVSDFSHKSDIKISKVIILGDVSVGKSCLVNRFCHQLFNSNYKATIGVDFEVEQFDILGIPFHLQIWDTAGQERFKCIAQSYYRFAHVIVIAFDLSCISTLFNCEIWLQDALNTSSKDPFIFLVGTKRDLVSPAAYQEIELLAMQVASNMNAEFWAVSAKTGNCIKELFFRIAALAFNSAYQREEIVRNITVSGTNILSLKNNPQAIKSNRIKCCK